MLDLLKYNINTFFTKLIQLKKEILALSYNLWLIMASGLSAITSVAQTQLNDAAKKDVFNIS